MTTVLELQYGKAQAALLEANILQNFAAKYPQIKVVMIPLKKLRLRVGMVIGINETIQSYVIR